MTAKGVTLWDRKDNPYQKTWEEWTEKWWEWLISIPVLQNPANDDTGRFCDKNQEEPVWNLTGSISGALADKGYRLGLDTVTRECTIPKGRSILIAVAAGVVSKKEYPDIFSKVQYLKKYVKSNYVSRLSAIVDGTPLTKQDFERRGYHVTTKVFPLDYGNDNIFGVPSGKSQAISDGYFLFLHPPSKKKFIIEFEQTTEANTLIKSEKFAYHLRYKISIQ
jgi:hypothetical protein